MEALEAQRLSLLEGDSATLVRLFVCILDRADTLEISVNPTIISLVNNRAEWLWQLV